jgi:hypothetical protein
MPTDDEIKRHLMKNADELTAASAYSRRARSGGAMWQFDYDLEQGPPLFAEVCWRSAKTGFQDQRKLGSRVGLFLGG